jgi:zinc carboxypeptidase
MYKRDESNRFSRSVLSVWSVLVLSFLVGTPPALAQAGTQQAGTQQIDEEYTRLINEYLTDARISTELVNYLPYSDVVPTTLEFPGIERIVGTPDELTYAEDIQRYLKAVAEAAPERARIIPMGLTEEGREMIIIAISNEETIANLDTYRGYLTELTDPRVTSEERAEELQKTAKPIYWITTGLHSSERGGPEMVMELAYRLVVDESDFIREIRDNVITFITPVLEVDGRERMVDTYHFNNELREQRDEEEDEEASGFAGRRGGRNSLPLMYWGKYVQHDNNRDGMGQFLALTRNTTKIALEWKPTVMHDLHEAQTLLYSSTGTGPYNDKIDAITVGEWWLLAQNDVMEMTKQGVPGVWTYNFYDGWTPNYLFYAAHSHNAVGRFYEVASYGPQNRTVNGNQSREWFRPNPLQESIEWGPRANTNIQQSAVLYSLHFTGHDRERFLENYWIKNRNAIERGTKGEIAGWVIPAGQHSKADAAMAVNDMIDQGLEFHTADKDFTVGDLEVKEGDYIVRGDQPYRTIADIYFSTQQFPVTNPRPYDDLGWTFHYMRDIEADVVGDQELLSRPMTAVSGHVTAAGGIEGDGATVVVAHTGDNNMVTLRFRFPELAMSAAEEAFEIDDQQFLAGSFIIANGNTPEIAAALTELGLTGRATDDAPEVPMHDLDIPRIGYIHSWSRTQDEGWVRASLDSYGVPYTYFGENEVHRKNLRDEFDVIIYPVGGRVGELVEEGDPIPYLRTEKYRSFGTPDSTTDVRGQLGEEGLQRIYEFVQAGGTLIAEGSTAAIFPGYDLTPGLKTVEAPGDLIARGSIFRGVFADETSPIRYGIERNQMPVYFSRGPILDAGVNPAAAAPASMTPAAPTRGGRRGGTSVYQNTQPMATPVHLASYDPRATWPEEGSVEQRMAEEGGARNAGGSGGGRSRFGGFGSTTPDGTLPGMGPRVILQFPAYAEDMLLTGGLENGQALSNRAQLVDSPVGEGHMVLFAIRPFWRWQTQGTYILGFNAIMNWNDLGAGQ